MQIVSSACSIVLLMALPVFGQDIELEDTQELTIPLTAANEAAAMMELPEGFEVTLFAAEPKIRQPISITTDTKGRIWIAECLTYAESKKNFDTKYNDRILIFEDTDNDGVADKRKVFWEGGKRLTSVEVGMGGVWVTCAPNLMFIPDRNGDDVPDGPPEILLDGFNADFVRHNLVNGLKFGPDGWLYGRHGIQATSHVGPPDSTDSQRTSLNCCIWKYHPVTREFEVVCEGTTNSWGHDWDEHGELFMINTVIGHLWHVVPGARYRRMYGSHFNPFTYDPIEQTADHFHFSGKEKWNEVNKNGISEETSSLGGGHAHCGLMIYQGNNWPEEYRGDVFTANFHGYRLNRESLEREGNGYVAHHEEDFMSTTDPWFRGVEMIYGPDGGVYVLDWSDIGECHENDGVHRTTGRVFKIMFREKQQHAPGFDKWKVNDDKRFDLSEKSNKELIHQLYDENRWYPRTVRKELQQRALDIQTRAEINGLLEERFESLQADEAVLSEPVRVNSLLQTLWTRYTINYGHNEPNIPSFVSTDINEHVRAWAIRFGLSSVKQRLKMAQEDPSGLVRLYLASSLGNLDATQRMQLATTLCQHPEDADDRTQAKLIWYNIEPVIVERWTEAINLANSSKLPHVRRCIVRRLAAEVDSQPELLAELLELAHNSPHYQVVIDAMTESLTGRRKVEVPWNWEVVSTALLERNDEKLNQSIAFLGTIFGEGASSEQLKKIASDGNKDPSVRRQAIKALGEAKTDGLFDFLKSQINDRSVAVQVVRSMALCDNEEVANRILNSFGAFDLQTERAAIATLCTRKDWAARLLEALGKGRVDKNRFSASHARQIKNLDDAELNELLAKHWGVIKDTSQDRLATISKIKTTVERTDITPDFANGSKLFEATCASCHVLYGEGGKRGPDLTGSDRKNIAYLLENVIDPSASVADTFRSSILLMEDGRTLIGVVTEESETTLKLLMVESEVVIDKTDIENRRNTTKSLMPDGLLDKLSEQEISDLFGYLAK